MFICVIADYGTGDPAFAEVAQRLLMAFPHAQTHLLQGATIASKPSQLKM
ncbi:MAG: hypothetical protein HXY43_07355 [Fischerella sp.]|jgi:hypothetical protein|nr:hypothetical protein [Fischerella sp.]NWF59115.1 hypothetical protein [Fischerella sp.]